MGAVLDSSEVRPRAAVVLVGVVAAIVAAGCTVDAGGGGRVASRTASIVDGEAVDGTRPAVVLVYNRAGGLCTGTLISPRVVLTAKHCVQATGASEPYSASVFIIGVGDNARGLSQQFTVQEIDTTPGSYSSSLRDLAGKDVAVMTLTTGAAIEPIPVRRESPEELIRETATAIGFGQRPEGSAGLKYETTTTVNGVMGDVVYTPPTICKGDSGGPLIDADGQVFGVASFGTGDCGSGINGYNAINNYLDMIDTAIGESGECLDDGEEVCDGFDNDCNDMVDEVCADLGEGCESAADCVGGEGGGLICEETSEGKICTRPCDPLRPFMGCGAGQYCARTSGCEGLCVPGTAGDKGNDEPCEQDTECASLLCADPGDGVKRCLTPCQGDLGMCYAGEVCAANPGQCNGCVPAGLVRGLRGLGEPCDADDACHSDTCFLDEGFAESAAYCSRACEADGECPDGFHCRLDPDGEAGLCVRGDRPGTAAGTEGVGVGAGCVNNRDCGPGGFCASRGEVSWCTLFCDSDEDCPTMFSCIEAGGEKLCAPDRALTGESCEADEDCVTGLCETFGVTKLCTRHCGPEVACSPGFECHRTPDGKSGVCLAAPEAAEDDGGGGGGGCAVSGHPRGRSGGLWVVGLLALAWLGRRRRRT